MHRRSTHVPNISQPAHKENPDVEELITSPSHHKDVRPQVVKPFAQVMHPQLNRMYGSLRVDDGWQYVIDNYANGGLTTVAAAQVTANVTLAQALPELRLERWPGAVSLYLVIRSFAMALSTATLATLGSLDVYYQDTIGGQTVPLGSIVSTDEINAVNCNYLIPTPITDPGITTVGKIGVTLSSGATVGTYIFQIAFSYAYLLPTTKPYDVQHVEDMLDAHPGYAQHHR
jgi:hypothetical protein